MDQLLHNGEAFIERMGPQINFLQIVQHAPQNLPVRDAAQKAVMEFDRIAISFVNAVAAIVAAEDLAAIERIEKEFFAPVGVFHDEVARQSHAHNRKIQPPRNFHVDRG